MAVTTAMIKELREATGAGILDSKKALEASGGDFDKAVEFLREKGLSTAAKKASREANDGLIAGRLSDDLKHAVLVEVNCETDFVARTDDFSDFVDSMVRQVFQSPSLNDMEALLAAPYIDDNAKTVADALQDAISKLGENIILRRFQQQILQEPGLIDLYVHANNRVATMIELQTNGQAKTDDLQTLAHDLALQVTAANPSYLTIEDVPGDVIENERRILLAQLEEDEKEKKKPENIKARIVDGRLRKFYQENCLLEQAFVKDDSQTIKALLKDATKTLGVPVKINRFTRFALGEA